MVDPVEDYLDRLLAPRSIDPRQVALILQPHMPDHTLEELEWLAADHAADEGFSCISQAAPVLEAG